jgi:hypothetical protein
MISKIVNTLRKDDFQSTSRTGFYAEYELNSDVLYIEVEGVGQINLPVDKKDIEKLLSISSQAKFGLREQTLLDKKVRNTQEIPANQLRIKYNENTFADMLSTMRDTLGLAKNTSLSLHLHNMLIYGPGQFFKKHQDSEKLDGMVATLVIVLPSSHIGGDLLIKHNNKQHKFISENLDYQGLKCIIFYIANAKPRV